MFRWQCSECAMLRDVLQEDGIDQCVWDPSVVHLQLSQDCHPGENCASFLLPALSSNWFCFCLCHLHRNALPFSVQQSTVD